ncbi:RluA family pseudouridine synthase [Clostridium oceanicum]|uniref:Pseudouridine synthase n=1 Tax=Clostridium oceanicum TaxID=1543 RepID=A0ABP3V383_9CLOT
MDNKLIFKVCSKEKMLVKDYLKQNEDLSSRFVRKSLREGRIFVNSKKTNKKTKVVKDDIVEVYMPLEEHQNIEPQKMDIDVVYEDVDIVVVNKRPGIVVHPTKSYPYNTLSNGVLYHFKENGEKCIVRLVSRLDMDTSGLILIAKNQFSHMALARDMDKEIFKKKYIAIVHGNIEKDEDVIDAPIYRKEDDSIKRVVDSRGQRSITRYKVIERLGEGTVVELTLETGRTHQIRVHMESLGNALYGDSLYGKGEEDSHLIKRQALHAYKLQIPHPRTGEIISLESDIPKDMKELKNYIKEKKTE